MSQFDFPRINFHGTAYLDTPTANNGNYEPGLTLFDQNESEAFLPPRLYIPNPTFGNPPVAPQQDPNGNWYVPINPVTSENYESWATTPLGAFPDDNAFWSYYQYLQTNPAAPGQPPVLPTPCTPGYWNFYGDLSLTTNDILVTGVTVPDPTNGSVTYTPQSSSGCPADLAAMLGAELSFNSNYFDAQSRTTAYLCDVDSIGQMCTQIFASQVGLYSNAGGKQTTFFSGAPCKSTARWMNLNRVLNYAGMVPMGGSASFYSTIPVDPNSAIAKTMNKYTGGKQVTGLFMKILIHEVYEVRSPDYTQLKTKKVRSPSGDFIDVPTNPATVSITGSITPAFAGEMQTTGLCRIMKSINSNFVPTPTGIPLAVAKNGSTVALPKSVSMGPMLFQVDQNSLRLSIDLSNAINEFGTNPGTLPPNAGETDIPPFQQFNSYDYGTINVLFLPDVAPMPFPMCSLDPVNDYGMQKLLATGMMYDVILPNTMPSYTEGMFMAIAGIGETIPLVNEDPVFMTSDQQGMYIEENAAPGNYMVDGLPLEPFTLRVLNRGVPVASNASIGVTLQSINMRMGQVSNVPIQVYDNMNYSFPSNPDGCMTYSFVSPAPYGMPLAPNFSNLFDFASQAYMMVLRTLSAESQLAPYLTGGQPITWQVVYDNVFKLYKTVLPIMDVIVPLTEANWSEPFMQQKMLQLIDLSNWQYPLYMPVTRDLSAAQRQLLQMWVQQSQQNPKPKSA